MQFLEGIDIDFFDIFLKVITKSLKLSYLEMFL